MNDIIVYNLNFIIKALVLKFSYYVYAYILWFSTMLKNRGIKYSAGVYITYWYATRVFGILSFINIIPLLFLKEKIELF